jgi:hypothetical protein
MLSFHEKPNYRPTLRGWDRAWPPRADRIRGASWKRVRVLFQTVSKLQPLSREKRCQLWALLCSWSLDPSPCWPEEGARGTVIGWHYVRSRKAAGSITDEVIGLFFFNWPNPSSRTMALESTQPVTEIGARNLPRGKGRPARKADSLTAVCERIV